MSATPAALLVALAFCGCVRAAPEPPAGTESSSAERCTAVALRIEQHVEETMLEAASTEVEKFVADYADAGVAREVAQDTHDRVRLAAAELEAQRVDRSTPIRLSCLEDWSNAVKDDQRYGCALASQSLGQALDCLGVRDVRSARRAIEQAAGYPVEP